jgi:hypothetical protein
VHTLPTTSAIDFGILRARTITNYGGACEVMTASNTNSCVSTATIRGPEQNETSLSVHSPNKKTEQNVGRRRTYQGRRRTFYRMQKTLPHPSASMSTGGRIRLPPSADTHTSAELKARENPDQKCLHRCPFTLSKTTGVHGCEMPKIIHSFPVIPGVT